MGLQVKFETIRSVASADVTASFTALGDPLAHPAQQLCITNTSDKDMLFSTDGTNAHMVVPAGSYKLFDFTTNSTLNNKSFSMATGTQLYIRYVADPADGTTIYVESIHN